MTTDWHGCCDGSHGEMIVADAYEHPAKFAPNLINRIYKHGFERAWWGEGSFIGDPFGGVACGGIYAAYHGFWWLGVELEPKFVKLAKKNIALHHGRWKNGGLPIPQILQGDSRKFSELVSCDAIITSPPWGSLASDDKHKDADLPTAHGGKGVGGMLRSPARALGIGHTPGQIGNLKPGKLDGVVTSPPWEDQAVSQAQNDTPSRRRLLASMQGGLGFLDSEYGNSEGQVGNTSGDTYWTAMKQVYQQCLLALKPGGMMVVVVKNYVSKGKRVPLCDQTLTLLESVGFVLVERIRAWMVKETKHPGLFGEVVEKISRKSFFRRVAEQKGSPTIDWEEVLCVRAPNVLH